MTHESPQPSALAEPPGRWWREWEVAAIVLLTVAIYFTRLTAQPVCGEESRWANGAREMIATGDWIVPRQQGTIFPERPPLGSWLMALVGLVRGEVDLLAIRLPSALAMVALAMLIYACARAWMSRVGSLCAAVMFVTSGQVMVLGRLGESDALFTLFTAGSLLVWHAGYVRGWRPAAAWSAGYSLAALGALVKGMQAPAYFCLATIAWLALRRDWRWLVGKGHLAGLACFAAIVGAWMVPFALSNPEALDDIWAGLIAERLTTQGLLKHLVSYPFETLGCLLPWSPLLVWLARPSVRKSVHENRPALSFIVLALVVTYPSVWWAAGARGRYFMPLYPLVAVLEGLVVEHCVSRFALPADQLFWKRFQRGLAILFALGGAALVMVNFLPIQRLAQARQPAEFLIPWLVASAVAAVVLARASRAGQAAGAAQAMLVAAGIFGLAYAGAVVNSRLAIGNDLTPAVADVVRRVERPENMVSLNRVYHRFAYSYGLPIRQIPWPDRADDGPPEGTYFCFNGPTRYNTAGLGPSQGHSQAVLHQVPFAWEKIAEIECDAVHRNPPENVVVIGRALRRPGSQPQEAASPVASRPEPSRPARR